MLGNKDQKTRVKKIIFRIKVSDVARSGQRKGRSLKTDDQTKQKDEKNTHIYRLKDKSDEKKSDEGRGAWKGSHRRWGSSAQMKRPLSREPPLVWKSEERKQKIQRKYEMKIWGMYMPRSSQ